MSLLQNAAAYLPVADHNTMEIEPFHLEVLYSQFRTHFFSPWHRIEPAISKKDAYWAKRYLEKEMFGINYHRVSDAYMAHLMDNSAEATYPSRLEKGVILRATPVRALPSQKPLFYNPEKAGEGYPFDMLQNCNLPVGTPVYITHESKDHKWVHVEYASSYGWVNALDVALIEDNAQQIMEHPTLLGFIDDSVPLMDSSGQYRGEGRVGTVLPVKRINGNTTTVYFPVKDASGDVGFVDVNVARSVGRILPLQPMKSSVAALADQIIGQQYGWGGLYELRDCSMTLQDIFRNMGIGLPRNSSQQAKEGRVLSLEGMSRSEKKAYIVEHGVPFFTTLYRRGHIVLYIGEKDGEPLIFHTMWGVKTMRKDSVGNEIDGRNVIGKSVVTTVSVGAELPDIKPDQLLIDKILSMQILSQIPDSEKCPLTR